MTSPKATSATPRRLRADAARNRQALIEAALRLFAARGLSVTPVKRCGRDGCSADSAPAVSPGGMLYGYA